MEVKEQAWAPSNARQLHLRTSGRKRLRSDTLGKRVVSNEVSSWFCHTMRLIRSGE